MEVPRPKQAMRGWRRLGPSFSRFPVPTELVAAVAVVLLGRNMFSAAVTILTTRTQTGQSLNTQSICGDDTSQSHY